MEQAEKQNLALIADMIAIAQREFNDNSFIYLMWGWVVSLCCIAQFVLLRMQKEYNSIVWLAVFPALIIQIIFMIREKRTARVKTHMDKIIGYVWMAVGSCIGIVLFSQGALQQSTFPVLILLYGIGTFISGSIMQLTAMKAGAICCGVIGLVAFHVSFEYQLLLLPLSLILAYIIPGYLLKSRFKKNV